MMVRFLFTAALVAAGCGAPAGGAAKRTQAVDAGPAALVDVRGPDGAPAPGVELWALHAGEFDPRAPAVMARVTGDRVETTRQLATWRGRSDGAGRGRIPLRGAASVLVGALDGARYGEVELGAAAAGGGSKELRLVERTAYPVRVVDGAGRPVGGAAVGLAARDGRGGRRLLPMAARTDDEGRATLFGAAAAPGDLEVVLRVATAAEQAAPAAAGTGAELVLPEAATVALRVPGHPSVAAGAPLAGFVQVFAAAEGSRSERTLAVPLVDGACEALPVEVGVPLRAVVLLADPGDPYGVLGRLTVELGPAPAGAVLEHTLDLGGWVLVRGTVEDAAGAALGHEALDLALLPERRATTRVLTDADGGFRWLVPPERAAAAVELEVRAGARRAVAPFGDHVGTLRAGAGISDSAAQAPR